MATVNNDTPAASTSSRTERKLTHYININAVRSDNTVVRLGAIHVYDGGDKAQRTLIDAISKGLDPMKVDIVLDVRSSEKSQDIDDISEWACRDGGKIVIEPVTEEV